jgi:hypothetical protein
MNPANHDLRAWMDEVESIKDQLDKKYASVLKELLQRAR